MDDDTTLLRRQLLNSLSYPTLLFPNYSTVLGHDSMFEEFVRSSLNQAAHTFAKMTEELEDPYNLLASRYRITLIPQPPKQAAVVLDDAVLNKYGLAANYHYDGLRRARVNCDPSPIKCENSFYLPTQFHLYWVNMFLVDEDSRRKLSILYDATRILFKLFNGTRFEDDLLRQFYQRIDKFLFQSINFGELPITTKNLYSSLHGLATIGGPRAWMKSEVAAMLLDWVTGDTTLPSPDYATAFWSNYDSLCREWLRLGTKEAIPYKKFIYDPLRWGTSGGAYKTTVKLESGKLPVRTKWGWFLSAATNGTPLEQELSTLDKACKVFVKEETKTRLVITTPMDSYLRQSYLLTVFGDMPLKSTLTSKTALNDILFSRPWHYVSLDASKFDHNVPLQFLTRLFKHILNLKTSDSDLPEHILEDAKNVAKEELKTMEGLTVVWDGAEIKHKKGLLSGWRFTSLYGSMLSQIVCELIVTSLGRRDIQYVVQGDDIILYSRQPIDGEKIIMMAKDIGMSVNEAKTVFGDEGEFLKFRYCKDVVTGSPARRVRTLFIANPWITEFTHDNPQTISESWWGYYSRMCLTLGKAVRAVDYSALIVNDLHQWFAGNISKNDISTALHTPLSVGGLGPIEWAQSLDTVDEISMLREMRLTGDEHFMTTFGIRRPVSSKFAKTTVRIKNIPVRWKRVYAMLYSDKIDLPNVSELGSEKNTNRTKLLVRLLGEENALPPVARTLLKYLQKHDIDSTTDLQAMRNFVWPPYLKKTKNWRERLTYLMEPTSVGFPMSLFSQSNSKSGKPETTIRFLIKSVVATTKGVTAAGALALSLMAIRLFLGSRGPLHSM